MSVEFRKKEYVIGWNIPGYLPEVQAGTYLYRDQACTVLIEELGFYAEEQPVYAER